VSGERPADVLLDCRWLANGGPGRVTELLLRGLAVDAPPGRWVLWGPPSVTPWAWPGAEVRIMRSDPRALMGQKSILGVPRCDVAAFSHHLRPLRAVPSLTWLHDTIPLRFASSGPDLRAKAWYLRRIATLSSVIATTTEYSRACIRRDLGVEDAKVVVIPVPFDDALSARVVELRGRVETTDTALFVGRFAPHKNLPRLVAAFARTEFAAGGGRLVLVGGTPDEIDGLTRQLTPRERSLVEMRSSVPQAELERFLASSRFAVHPSLEEGFGLPAWEALCCGLALCVSDGGALPEITHGLVEPFPARSVDAMTSAMDECAERARACPERPMERLGQLRGRAPSVGEFARMFREALSRVTHR
jgi:glycosyltransferase involved in cell wall biosynthesis